jgi:DNA-binding response OmpR family regulator
MSPAIPKVLVVEDDPSIIDILRDNLSRMGCIITYAITAEKGIEAMQHSRFHAVLAGLCVRINGGRSIARWAKTNSPQTRCYIITGWKGELEKNLLDRDGIAGIIRKPISFRELHAMLSECEGIKIDTLYDSSN